MSKTSRSLGLRLLHTSDWHIGRTFHAVSTLAALEQVLDALVDLVRQHQVDVVVVAGDVFDSSTPSAEAVQLLDRVLAGIISAGAKVVLSSGNHDSPARLGAKGAFAAAAGVHLFTEPEQITQPVLIEDAFGNVAFFGIPYLEPARMRTLWPDAEQMRSQADALAYAVEMISGTPESTPRSVVLAHTFAQGVQAEDEVRDVERDIVGGVDKVPITLFDQVSYTALGHIHGRQILADNLRYSGAPLHYSFGEARKPRGAWLVDFDATRVSNVEWLPLPVPRQLSVLTGTLEELLTAAEHTAAHDHWVSAVLTDNTLPRHALNRLRERFAYCVHVEHRPEVVAQDERRYAEMVRGRSDLEVISEFLNRVRNGEGPTQAETELLSETIQLHEAESRNA